MGSKEAESVGQRVENVIVHIFKDAGWKVDRYPECGPLRADLSVSHKGFAYIAEIKASSEGRPDRVIALLAQAAVQAQAYAWKASNARPLAIVWVGHATSTLLKKIDDFHRKFLPDVAIGVVAGNGSRHFVGPGLSGLNAQGSDPSKDTVSLSRQTVNLFSDLNQWMLKVLLAPEIPEHLLAAPRNKYSNVSELAAAAGVSVMSASRFATRLRGEGFLDERGEGLRLVRRSELFKRWQSIAMRSSAEARMRFLIPGTDSVQLRKLVLRHNACLGLFAAADALGLGHVSGVPPYIYVPKAALSDQPNWKGLVPASPDEQPHVIIKQALAPQSLFRGAVMQDGLRVADVLQIWLDVSSHPSRGAEQAELLRRKVLQDIIGEAA